MRDDDFFDRVDKSLDDEWQFEEWDKECSEDNSDSDDAEEDSNDDAEADTDIAQDFYAKPSASQKPIPASKPSLSSAPASEDHSIPPWVVIILVPFFFGLCFRSFTAVIIVFILEALLYVLLWFSMK